MTRTGTLRHEFVEYIPAPLVPGTLYVSIAFATAVHQCCCGCGQEVVTPITPTDWSLTFDGDTVSLDPSIGNWSFACQSHYFIRRNRVQWADRWTPTQIADGRALDRARKVAAATGATRNTATATARVRNEPIRLTLWRRVQRWFGGS